MVEITRGNEGITWKEKDRLVWVNTHTLILDDLTNNHNNWRSFFLDKAVLTSNLRYGGGLVGSLFFSNLLLVYNHLFVCGPCNHVVLLRLERDR